jgi:hypothetical protein
MRARPVRARVPHTIKSAARSFATRVIVSTGSPDSIWTAVSDKYVAP